MNYREFKCATILSEMVDNYGLVGIKTSFEDEGASFDEVIRLKEICNQAKTKITLKVQGPEASRDIRDSEIIGVKGLVAPMVESAFGLEKYINSTKVNLSPSVREKTYLAINVETIQAYNNLDFILKSSAVKDLYGITIGRVDFVSSMGKDRSFVNSKEMYEMVESAFTRIKKAGLSAYVGGAITTDSYEFLSKLYKKGLLNRFETRYAIYDPSIALKNLNKALAKGQLFEYEWLVNKSENYQRQADKEKKRIQMIQDRINQSTSI